MLSKKSNNSTLEDGEDNSMPKFDADGVVIVAAVDLSDPTHDLISVDSSTAESSTGDDGGGDAGVGPSGRVPAIVSDLRVGQGGIIVGKSMTTSPALLRVYLSQLRL